MVDRKKLEIELDRMKAEFMKLDSDEAREAFRKNMEVFVDLHTPEERAVLGNVFLEGARKAEKRAGKLYDDVLRNYLQDIYQAVSWSYIAQHYFGKSRSWLSQRINSMKVHDKSVEFTDSEKKILLHALLDLSCRIKHTAQIVERL